MLRLCTDGRAVTSVDSFLGVAGEGSVVCSVVLTGAVLLCCCLFKHKNCCWGSGWLGLGACQSYFAHLSVNHRNVEELGRRVDGILDAP